MAVLVALGVGLAPAAALADETPMTAESGTSGGGSESTSSGTAGPAGTEGEQVPPTLLEALAAAHQANLGLGGGGVGVEVIGDDDLRTISAAVAAVISFLKQPDPPDVDPGEVVDVEELLATAEELRARLEAMRGDVMETYDAVEAEVAWARGQAQSLADSLSEWAWAQVGGVVDVLPTAEEVQTLARSLETFARDQADAAAMTLLAELARVAAYLTDDEHQRTVKTAVTTLLLTLANAVNPLPSWLAPTAEAAVNASGELVSWADELAQQGVEGPGPFYDQTDTDTDEPEPSPTDDLTPLDSDVVVAEEAITVEQPIAITKPLPPASDITLPGQESANALYDCSDYRQPNELCVPARSHGGRVIQKPIVRVVLVGSWWHGAGDLRAGLDNVFGSMSGSGYQNILRQYWDYTGGYIGADVVYQGSHLIEGTPPAVVSGARVASYAVRASRERAGWKTSPSVVWVVALPPNSLADHPVGSTEKCGYQGFATSGDQTYVIAEVDYPRSGCTFGKGVRGGLTSVAVHEYVGSVVNPDGRGWHDKLGKHLPDLCGAKLVPGPGGEWVSMVWSNGDNRCVSSFTPRFAFEVSTVRSPDGDTGPDSRLTRGHSYPGAFVSVTNTGNMPWLSYGGKKTYLATSDNLCSPFADTSAAGSWASCRRINLPQPRVEARASAIISFGVRPDGSLVDGDDNLFETFTMVAGSTWMDRTGTAIARITNIDLQTFNAGAVDVADVGYVAVGQSGTDVKVTVTLQNTGSAYWYPREVMYIGTPSASRYAATSWPSGPDGCRACRAHRFDKLTAPGGFYTFDLTLHLPATSTSLLEEATFFPYADVKRVSDGGISQKQLKAGRIRIQVVRLPKPVAVHDVTGYGFAGGDTGSTPVDESGFSCLAAAGADAVTTRIRSCTATVTTGYGYTYTMSAAPASAVGAVAWTGGTWASYTPAAGDTITVCWDVASEFLDGTADTHTGCSG